MDAFIQNVPMQVSESQTRDFFAPRLACLGIKVFHVRKAVGKTFATLTFLDDRDCQKFLTQYQTTPTSSGAKAKQTRVLAFHNKPLLVKKSDKRPEPHLVRALELSAKKTSLPASSKQLATVEERGNDFSSEVFTIQCGLWNYAGADAVFVSHLALSHGGNMKFGSHKLVFTATNNQTIAISYTSVQEIVAVASESSASLIFTLKNAPHFSAQDPLAALANLSLSTMLRRDKLKDIRVSSLNRQHEELVFGCLVYRFEFVPLWFRNKLMKLRSLPGFPHVIMSRVRVVAPLPEETWSNQWEHLTRSLSSRLTQFPFEVLFQVQKMAQNGYLQPAAVASLLPTIDAIVKRSGTAISTATLKMFCERTPWPGPDTEAEGFCPSSLINYLEEYEEKITKREAVTVADQSLENVAIIHRATVTPTSIRLSGPERENKNRVLRKYPQHHGHFLRVTFTDEDGDQVYHDPNLNCDNIFYVRFRKVLDNGISIAGRKYSFLGFSHSSLRAQTCWFMAPFVHENELMFDRMVIRRLGQFDKIRSPAKCAARIGQAFSETPITIELGDTTIYDIADIQKGERVFSDGCGTISRGVLEKIWTALPSARRVKPLLFQIRHGGAKGMLSLDSRLKGNVMAIRPSMTKFPSTDNKDIELCGAAYRPLPLYLNRQFIKIMEDLGVADSWFIRLQALAVARLRESTSDPHLAAKFLKQQSAGDAALVPDLIRKLAYCGLPVLQADEFLATMVQTAMMVELRNLKHKTRIYVEEGATLYGIMDETNTLQEGEVFITLDTKEWRHKVVVGERIVITRAPALHPGDVRVVKAVTLPDEHPLMELRNCVVFSQQGERDLPSQLSGGDLDGDLFNVVWDVACQPKVIYSPADYPRQEAINIGREVTAPDMTDFFVTFMAQDQLGRIATAHQILADQKEEGTVHPDCILLAEMHSTAVDYSKTGIPVDMRRMPKYERARPDFMAPGAYVKIYKKELVLGAEPSVNDQDGIDGPTTMYYESQKILGKLYRSINVQQVFREAALHIQSSGQPDTMRRALQYILLRCQERGNFEYQHHLEWARGIRDMYEDYVRTIIADFSTDHRHPVSEVELIVGNILGKVGAPSKRQRDLSTSMKEEYDAHVNFIINSISRDKDKRSPEARERSIACFVVSFEESYIRSHEEELKSFMYVAAAVAFREVEGL